MRRGKYYYYKLALLQYLVDNNFIIKIGEGNELTDIARKLNMPMSSWYDITKSLQESNFIIIKSGNRWFPSGISVWMAYEIQLTKKGLEFLNHFNSF